ncbi:hypothetical protein CAPN001_01170 [Capnocytophaga stomatis]|nr:hypothetical protein CAPN001_01170 [Capnocytophaga stomatis]GIM49744.1 hypothetical protein CAPN003_11960 [Capnocytophaga stomatis]
MAIGWSFLRIKNNNVVHFYYFSWIKAKKTKKILKISFFLGVFAVYYSILSIFKQKGLENETNFISLKI